VNPLFIAVIILGVFVLAVFFECLSQLTYQRKSIAAIKAGLRRTMLKVFLAFMVMGISSLVWWHMGWKDGQEIHLHWPWHSN
jgi:hypothetical protein